MSVQLPHDNNHYMDTAFSLYMSSNQGKMLSLTPCLSKFIMVDNGAIIPFSHIGHMKYSHLQNNFVLNDVLVSLHMIKNLVSVRKFTRDNFVSIMFYRFAFSVKDLNLDTFLQ